MGKTTNPKQTTTVSEFGSLEKEVIRIIQEVSHTNILGLAADDIKLIAKELMPDIDAIIAKKVKSHFYEMGVFMTERFHPDGQ